MSTRSLLVLLFVATSMFAQSKSITASEVIDRIKQHVGVEWQEPTVDMFKAGDPSTRVTGIAVTMMATFDVLQRAAADGNNLVITHEPTYYNHWDSTSALERADDPVFKAKREFIRQHHLVIWRFHDHWHRRSPDGIMMGVVRSLGWEKARDAVHPDVFNLETITLRALAESLKKALGGKTMRVIGDPEAKISRVGLSPGFAGFAHNRELLQVDSVEAVVIGEDHEWESVAYAVDAVKLQQKKGYIVLGHISSEQAGMEECARWLKGFVAEVQIEFVPTREPFWSPK